MKANINKNKKIENVNRKLHSILMDTSNCISIQEALKRAKKKWHIKY